MEGITKNVEKVMKVMDLFAGCGGLNINALSSKVALWHFCTKEFRKRSSDIQMEKDIIVNSIVDNNGYDYDMLAADIQKGIKIMEKEKIDEGKVLIENEYWDCYNNRYREWTSGEVIDKDNEAYKDNSFNKNNEVNKSHENLLDNADYIYGRVKDELTGIYNMLVELSDYQDKLCDELDSKYEAICKRYKEGRWKDDKEKLKSVIFVTLNGLDDNEEKMIAIERCIKRNKMNYSSSEKEFVESYHPARYLYDKRKEISEECMYSLIQARYVEETLESIKTYFMLKGESNYPHLFKDLASQKFVTTMLPSLLDYDEFETKYKRLGILFACHDLRLTKWDSKKCVNSFNELVFEALNDNNCKMPNARTYQIYYRKLSEKRFHKLLKKEELIDNEKTIIEELKDGYHFALSSLCLALDRKYPPLELDLPSEMKKLHTAAIYPKDLHDKMGNHIDPKTLYRYQMVVNGDVKEFVFFNNDL